MRYAFYARVCMTVLAADDADITDANGAGSRPHWLLATEFDLLPGFQPRSRPTGWWPIDWLKLASVISVSSAANLAVLKVHNEFRPGFAASDRGGVTGG